MDRIVMFSGGIGSWSAATRVVERYGADNVRLLFSDTNMEDEDLYRFIDQAAENIGAPLVRIADGRTPWDVFFDERMLGNSRFDPCSKILKRQMVDRWLTDNCDPTETVVYVGIDWTESHRFDNGSGGGLRPRRAEAGWQYEAPMTEAPYLTKRQMFSALAATGIRQPRLYDLGFSHNNCGGFCIKAGQGHYARLLETMPDRYAFHEQKEQEIRQFLGRDDISMLTDRRGDGKKKPLTLKDLRERIEAKSHIDAFEVGGCGCFIDEPA